MRQARSHWSHFHGIFANAHSTSLAIVRPSNLYGPGQSLLGGFWTGFGHCSELRPAWRGVVEMWGDGVTCGIISLSMMLPMPVDAWSTRQT